MITVKRRNRTSGLPKTGRVRGSRTSTRGLAGEEAACAYLRQRGYRIIARNWRCRYGEIDIIAEQTGLLVIVEVKSRRHGLADPYSPLEAVDARKQLRVIRSARMFIFSEGRQTSRVRFDLICVLFSADLPIVEQHLLDAFTANRYG